MWEVADWPGLGRPEKHGTSQQPPLQLHKGEGHNGKQAREVVDMMQLSCCKLHLRTIAEFLGEP